MKKQLLSLMAIATSGLCFSQSVLSEAPAQINLSHLSGSVIHNNIIPSHGNSAVAQNRAVSIWLDDFSNPSTWTVDNDGQTGPTFGWDINSTSESWFTGYDFPTGIASTSGGNFAELENGDYNVGNQAIGVTYNLTTATSIDVNALTGGNNDVSLQFEQYGGLFNDSQVFQISTDGTSWTTVGDNNSRATFIGNNPAALYANPETVTINIASAIAASPSTVWIRFSYTSRFPTDPGTNAWTTFGWYIDDVNIVATPQNDIKMIADYCNVDGNISQEIQYYSTPIDQIQPWNFYSTFTNIGTQTQNSVETTVDINSGLFTGTSASSSILSTDTTFLDSVLTSFTPPAIAASYTVVYNVASSNADDEPLDNTVTETYIISEDTYSRDNGNVEGAWGIGNNYNTLGNLYEMFQTQMVQAIEFNIGSNSAVGAYVEPVVYQYDGSSWNMIMTGGGVTITAQDLTNGVVTLDFGSGADTLQAGVYMFGLNGYSSADDIYISTSGIAPVGTSFIADGGGTFYYVTNTPMVRVIMGTCETFWQAQSQPTIYFPNYENFVCSGNCVTELGFSVNDGNYIEVFDENLTLVGSGSVSGTQSRDTITGTFCLGETYAAVSQSRCDVNSPFIQESDTIFFELLNTDIDIVVQITNESGCGANDGSATFLGDFFVTSPPNSYTINWSGPQSGTVSGAPTGGIMESFGSSMPAGSYTGEYINNELGCDPVSFDFVIGNNDNVTIDNSLTVMSSTSSCTSSDGFINIIVNNPSGNNVDVSWTGPVSFSFTNIPPSSGPTNFINIPALSNGTYEIIASATGNPTCTADTIYVDVTTNTVSQEVCVVTVDELTSNYNIVVWEKPSDMTPVDSFFVYREITTNNYQKIGALDGTELSEYEDFAANPNATNYKYKIKVLDVCGSLGDYGLYHNSIHLQYLGSGNFQWTAYEIEATSNQVGSYNFYRDDNGTGNFVLLQIIPGGNTTFTDVDFATFPDAVYRVDVNWTSGLVCTSSKANTNTSRSNKKQQIAGTPNAIIELLSGETSISPVPANDQINIKVPASIKNSEFKILNSIGQVVYSSIITDETTTLNISDYTNGVYIVVIETNFGSIAKKLIKE